MPSFALGWIAGVATLGAATAALLWWNEVAIERAIKDPRCRS